MAPAKQVTRHPEADAVRGEMAGPLAWLAALALRAPLRPGSMRLRTSRGESIHDATTNLARRFLSHLGHGHGHGHGLALLCLILATGCTPHQTMRLGSYTQPQRLPTDAGAGTAAAKSRASRESASLSEITDAEAHSGASAHGEKIDPFEIEKPPLDDEQTATLAAPSIDAPGTPGDGGDPVETSRASLAAEGSITQTNLLDEDLSIETDHSRAIDAPMSELVRAPSGTGEAKLADSAVQSVLLASHTEDADRTIAPGANDAGPPTPPWLKRNQALPSVRAVATNEQSPSRESSRRAAAAAQPRSATKASPASPNGPAAAATARAASADTGEAFDPFEGTTFAAASRDAENSNESPAAADHGLADHADEGSATEVASNSRQSATAIAAQMMARRDQKPAARTAAKPQPNAVAQASNPRNTAPPRGNTGDKPRGNTGEPPYEGPPIPLELSASMGDTLLKYASFAEAPPITPIAIVYTPQMDVDAEVLAMEEAVHGATTASPAHQATPATAARPATATKRAMKSQPAAAKKKAARANPVRTASRDTMPQPPARPAAASGVATASLQTPATPAPETGLRDTGPASSATNHTGTKSTPANPDAPSANATDAPTNTGWQPVRKEQSQPWKSKK